ncbi:predicted protein [Histoplasma mississippiense (nom. inval.)]|uniref:predicted protein n=1 Tax=Ajellomyces capsulatus (strain NAm1 / WU24) TaxID=2059318 RepID=UPI000157BD3C|nr:predicted protein [Histoplasma mississippiense (nom. inval.)]EDN06269.1 predicted protein [Histoplasma mississippiense (nom. inval.)]
MAPHPTSTDAILGLKGKGLGPQFIPYLIMDDIEKRIQNAIEVYNGNQKQKILPLARKFNIPYQPLRARINGRKTRNAKIAPNKKLSKSQEDVLKDKMWIYRYIKSLDGYKRVKQKAMDLKRIAVEDINYIKVWFDCLEILLQKYAFQTCDIYNFDEIGFQEGQGCREWVITAFKDLNSVITSSYSQGLITVIECISADGEVLNPFIIMKIKTHFKDWYTQSNLLGGYMIAMSDTGYTNDEIGFAWIQHFNKVIKKHQQSSH